MVERVNGEGEGYGDDARSVFRLRLSAFPYSVTVTLADTGFVTLTVTYTRLLCMSKAANHGKSTESRVMFDSRYSIYQSSPMIM